jgi:hypothetical protein
LQVREDKVRIHAICFGAWDASKEDWRLAAQGVAFLSAADMWLRVLPKGSLLELDLLGLMVSCGEKCGLADTHRMLVDARMKLWSRTIQTSMDRPTLLHDAMKQALAVCLVEAAIKRESSPRYWQSWGRIAWDVSCLLAASGRLQESVPWKEEAIRVLELAGEADGDEIAKLKEDLIRARLLATLGSPCC